MRVAVEVCPLCEGTGWKTIIRGKDRRVTRCDCQLRARAQSLLASARIPKRYEHCELSEFDTRFEGANPSLERALVDARRFVASYPVEKNGLLLIGDVGLGKTHLAVGIVKELIRTKGISCLFCDYRELLKQVQNSYNPSVQATELGILRPIFEAEVLLIDELGAQIPTGWIWDTVSFVLNTRYNEQKTVILTTNFENKPAARELEPNEQVDTFEAKRANRKQSLGDRITERMRSRLNEMCKVIKLEGSDFRQKFRSASFR